MIGQLLRFGSQGCVWDVYNILSKAARNGKNESMMKSQVENSE